MIRRSLSVALVIATMTSAGIAAAEDQCPLGSAERTEAGFTWCEPSVCDADNQCKTGSVCRPVPLCVEVGALEAGAGGARLLARQRCGENKSCPQNTTCSEKSRCITQAQADKAKSSVTTTDSARPVTDPPAKKACGCDVPGARGGGLAGALLAMLGIVGVSSRRRLRRGS